jgi:hypothetical protein
MEGFSRSSDYLGNVKASIIAKIVRILIARRSDRPSDAVHRSKNVKRLTSGSRCPR